MFSCVYAWSVHRLVNAFRMAVRASKISFCAYRVTGRRVTDRRDAEAIFWPFCGAAASSIFAEPILPCHQIAIGLAIAIVEYVPRVRPTSNASEKLRSTSPPNNTSERTDKMTSPAVITVRESV